MSTLPKSVEVRDDTMREGLQIESRDTPVEAKLRLLDALGETGLRTISIGSFVSPKWTPQMACIDELAERFVPKPGVRYTAVVFNRQGFERADRFYPKIDVRTRAYATHVEFGRTFAMRNYNRTPEQLLAQGDAAIARAAEAGAASGAVALGVETGLDLDKLEAAAIAQDVAGHPLWGHVSKAGPRPRGDALFPKDLPFVETLEEASHFRRGPSVYAHQVRPWREDSVLMTATD